jgi:hypothetical protein|tara:strand:- start:74 stop:499 length:426 start_codon:yes stop_codon:yes gene_type:complete
MARPRKINKKLIELILNKISDGESLREIFETPNNGIDCSWPTFRKALVADDSLMSRYEKSKSLAVDFLLSDLEFKRKKLEKQLLDGEIDPKQGHNLVNILKIMTSNRQWSASKLRPKVYSRAAELRISGEKEQPLNIKWTN